MKRNYSLSSFSSSSFLSSQKLLGHQGNSLIIDCNTNAHNIINQDLEEGNNHDGTYGTLAETGRDIRVQVIIWSIGSIDVLTVRVPVQFRTTLFWNDLEEFNVQSGEAKCEKNASLRYSGL